MRNIVFIFQTKENLYEFIYLKGKIYVGKKIKNIKCLKYSVNSI